jgi:hypothetical protein
MLAACLGVLGRRRISAVAAELAILAVLALAAGGWLHPAHAAGPCDPPITNPIPCENSKPGNPASEWDISGSGDASIQGFATDISYNRGTAVAFKIKTPASASAGLTPTAAAA